MPRASYVEQVQRRYVAGKLDVDQFERDLEQALKLEDGQPLESALVPCYLRDGDGYYLRLAR